MENGNSIIFYLLISFFTFIYGEGIIYIFASA